MLSEEMQRRDESLSARVVTFYNAIKAIHDALPPVRRNDWVVLAIKKDDGKTGTIVLTTKNGTSDGGAPTIFEVVWYS